MTDKLSWKWKNNFVVCGGGGGDGRLFWTQWMIIKTGKLYRPRDLNYNLNL